MTEEFRPLAEAQKAVLRKLFPKVVKLCVLSDGEEVDSQE